MATEGDRSEEVTKTRRLLVVGLDLEVPPTVNCPLQDLDENVLEFQQRVAGDDCHLEVERGGDESAGATAVTHHRTDVQPDCPCPRFLDSGCLPEIVGTDWPTIYVRTRLEDRDCLSDLITSIRQQSGEVTVRRLKRLDAAGGEVREKFVTVDLFQLTEKQRQAITAAVAAGYYSSPRETSLGELAERLEISKSALSQRLKAAESKLVNAAFSRASISNQ